VDGGACEVRVLDLCPGWSITSLLAARAGAARVLVMDPPEEGSAFDSAIAANGASSVVQVWRDAGAKPSGALPADLALAQASVLRNMGAAVARGGAGGGSSGRPGVDGAASSGPVTTARCLCVCVGTRVCKDWIRATLALGDS
jgi:hypothetical protein